MKRKTDEELEEKMENTKAPMILRDLHELTLLNSDEKCNGVYNMGERKSDECNRSLNMTCELNIGYKGSVAQVIKTDRWATRVTYGHIAVRTLCERLPNLPTKPGFGSKAWRLTCS